MADRGRPGRPGPVSIMTSGISHAGQQDTETRRRRAGVGYGLAAYTLWGVAPLLWQRLEPSSAWEILAMRIVWSMMFAIPVALLTLRRGWWLALITRRNLIMLGAAALLVSTNWGVYVWATNHGHVTDTALGYYISPLVSVLLGVLVLHERPRREQWVAVGLASTAVLVLAVETGHVPWIALTLAVTFGGYGLIKNRVKGAAIGTLVVESGLLFLPAVACLIVLQTDGRLTFLQLGWAHSALLAGTGLMTLVPLALFAAAVTRLPLGVVGLLQYLIPTLQFLLGVFWFGEKMSPGRWVGCGIVWIALLVLILGSLTGRPIVDRA